jgi:hypothetical protein
MEKSPSKANRSSDSQDIPRLVWKAKVYDRIHDSPPHDPLLSQLSPFLASNLIY